MTIKNVNLHLSQMWSFAKKAGAAIALGGVLLWGKETGPATQQLTSIDNRVLAMRNALHSKVDAFNSDHKGLQSIQEKLTRSEMQVAQWGNWNNWGNWANWSNWNNWSQFGNVFNNY